MRKRSVFILVVLFIVTIVAVNHGVSAEVTVEATLSHQTFAVDEGARLSIAVNGVRKNAEIALPEIKNIKLHQRGQSSQTSFVNGKMSAAITYNFIVQALVPGKYTIPPIKVRAGGEELMTKGISFEVTGTGAVNTSSQDGGKTVKDVAFITVSETGDHYPGEIVPITLKVYFNRNYRVDLNSLPSLSGDGVVMSQLSSEPEQKQEVMDGVPFHVLTWKTSLSGIKTGTHSLTFSLDATLLIAQQRRGRSFGGSMFDDSLFDSFFGNVQRKPIKATSPEVTFNVLDLPKEGRPDNFTGAIGNFTMDVSGTPVAVEVGEPITLTMTINGEGNFNRVEAPVFQESQFWKTYSPTSDYSADSDKNTRSKSFEQAIVVKQSGVNAIPSLSFSYFHPGKRDYVTLQSKPIPLQVQGDLESPLVAEVPVDLYALQQVAGSKPATTAPGVAETKQPALLPQDANLAPIHLETGSLHTSLTPLFKKIWFIALCVMSLLAIIVLLYLNWRQQKEQLEPGRLLMKKRISQLQADLIAVEEARSTGDAALFLGRCRATIQNHVGASRIETASAMSLTDLKTKVAESSPLVTIFSRAEEAAYGGATLSSEEMANYSVELKSELEKL
jgi:BatD DUF11 like domain